MNNRRQYGFTLIELMIVVAIVGILAAIAYPSYQEQVRKSRRARCNRRVNGAGGSIGEAIYQYGFLCGGRSRWREYRGANNLFNYQSCGWRHGRI